MTKTQSHIIVSIFDLIALGGIIIFYHNFHQIVLDTQNQVDTISFSSRIGFLILGIFVLIFHIFVVFEYFRPEWVKKNIEILNISTIVMFFVLIIASFTVSIRVKSTVENAGYVYCDKASGASPLYKTLVYTKNMDICEELVASGKIRY